MDNKASSIYGEAIFKFNRKTAEEWEQSDLILEEGEPALLINENGDTVEVRYGNGKDRFVNLPVFKNKADIKYNPESTNAQSGIAVAEAIEGLDDVFASVIKPTLTGNTIAANDVSPIEHELKVKVKNYFDLKNVKKQSTENYSVTVNDDNSLNVTKATGDWEDVVLGRLIDLCPTLSVGNTITLSYKANNGMNTLKLKLGSDTELGYTGSQNNTFNNSVLTLTLPDDVSELNNVYVWFYGAAGMEHILTDIRIYTGDIADVTFVTVSRYGKNLCDGKYENGAILSGGGENTDNVSGTVIRTVNYIPILPNTVYTMTNPVVNKANKTRFYGRNYNYLGYAMSSPNFISNNASKLIVTGTTPADAYYMRFELNFNDVETADAVKNGELKYQFELGNKATEYEPYIEPQTAYSNEKGIVEGLMSISPSMTLMSNDADITIECEYNADTKMYIDNKFNELSKALLNS